MKNLRISQINVVNSTNISVIFTESLSPNIRTSNVNIIADTANISNPDVLSIKIIDNILNIECQPLTSFSSYFIEFFSTQNVIFESLNGDAILLEDGVANKQLILGPIDPSNIVHDY